MYLRAGIWILYAVLVAIAVPWYWRWFPCVAELRVAGAPIWVATSVAASVAISGVTAWLLARPWPGEEPASKQTVSPPPAADESAP